MTARKSKKGSLPIRRLPKKNALLGMKLCLGNGRALLRDAQSLSRRRAYNRAFVLAALSLEETGKVVFLTLLSHREFGSLPDRDLKKVWRGFRDHERKTLLVLEESWKKVLYVYRARQGLFPRQRTHRGRRILAKVRRLMEAHKRIYRYLTRVGVDDIPAIKIRALYVDVRGRKFLAPRRVPEAAAKGLMEIAGSAIEDAGRLRDTFRESRGDALAEDIINIMFKREMLHGALEELKKMEAQQPN